MFSNILNIYYSFIGCDAVKFSRSAPFY
jgi:hypothetical protein